MKKLRSILSISIFFAFATLSIFALTACPDPAIRIFADKTDLFIGEKIDIGHEILNESYADHEVTFEITSGQANASIDGNTLIVNANATAGASISVEATVAGRKSNVLTFNILSTTPPLESIAAVRVPPYIGVLPQSQHPISYTLAPFGAVAHVEWEIIYGEDSAVLANPLIDGQVTRVVRVLASANDGDIIRVAAKSGTIVSNILEFVVISQAAVQATIAPVRDTVTVHSIGGLGGQSQIGVDVTDASGIRITHIDVEFEVISGQQFIALSGTGHARQVAVQGHGQAIVQARLQNGSSTNILINAIRPPDYLRLPEFLQDREGINYRFSRLDHTIDLYPSAVPTLATLDQTPAQTTLPFEIERCNNPLAFQGVVFVFERQTNGGSWVVDSTLGSVDTETNQITFDKTGLIRVTARSNAGMIRIEHEASVSQIFEINEGINVSTFEQLKSTVESPLYSGQAVNVVITQRPTGTRTDIPINYGFELVPQIILDGGYSFTDLNGHLAQDIESKYRPINILVRRGLLNLFGNGYAINTENLRYFPTSQIPIGPAGAESRYQEPMMAVLMIDNFYNRADENRLTTVNISDLDFYGNVNMSGISNTRDQSGNLIPHSIINNDADLGAVHGRAISIGTLVEEERSSALVNIDNVNVSGFFSGIISFHLLDGSIIQNSSVRNCYKSGLEFRASVATVKNVEFSTLGGVPLELLPAGANDAGPNFDQPQRIVLEGDSHFNHMLNGGNVLSAYMDNFSLNVPNVPFITLPDFDIPSIIRYILTHIRTQRSLTTQQAMAVESNIMTEADQFVFVASQLQDPLNLDQSRNPSVFLCGNESMMNLADVDLNINGGINTTHRFLYIELAADLLPIVGIPPIPFILPHFMINAGRLVMLNLNYGRILDQNGDE